MNRQDQLVTATIEIETVTATKTFPEVPVVIRSPGWMPQTETLVVRLSGPVKELEAIGADAVTALVLIPEQTAAKQITVALDPFAAARVEISHGGSERIEALSIDPARLVVEPAP